MIRDHKDCLKDIIENIELIEKFMENITFQEFKSNIEKQYAVIRALEIIGIASKGIPENIQNQFSYINWYKLRKMRNIIAHEYFVVSLNVVWKTIEEILPDIKVSIEKMINELS